MASLQQGGRLLETSCGSPHYASPEIIRGVKYDGATADVWSCGVILYALLTGNLPFDDENIRRLLGKVKTGVYTIPSHISSNARDLITRMLTVDPASRITLREVVAHPWFNKGGNEYHRPLSAEVNMTPVSADEVDADILHSLQFLGWGNRDNLMAALANNE